MLNSFEKKRTKVIGHFNHIPPWQNKMVLKKRLPRAWLDHCWPWGGHGRVLFFTRPQAQVLEAAAASVQNLLRVVFLLKLMWDKGEIFPRRQASWVWVISWQETGTAATVAENWKCLSARESGDSVTGRNLHSLQQQMTETQGSRQMEIKMFSICWIGKKGIITQCMGQPLLQISRLC